MTAAPAKLKIKFQILAGEEIAMGPGKAELLEWVRRTGSISGAARGMGLSYRRAWLLVDAMNRCFAEPLVETSHGGAKGGGARVTDAGLRVLEDYRRLTEDLHRRASEGAASLVKRLK